MHLERETLWVLFGLILWRVGLKDVHVREASLGSERRLQLCGEL